MSAVVKTMTPFIDQQILMLALESLGFSYSLQGKDIVTERVDYYGAQKFVWAHGQYVFQHDSSATLNGYRWQNLNAKAYKTVGSFLEALEREYGVHYQRLLEEAEQKRLEELELQRKAFVQQQKEAIVLKAKEQGYVVKEKTVGNKVQLVLVKHTY
jgi:hypothetical protein